MTTTGTFSFDTPGDASRAAELRRVKWLATLVLAANARAVRGREALAERASGVRLHRGLCGSRHHRRARRLVCGGGAVQAAAGPADPAHRDHPEQPAAHRRQARRVHRGAFPRGGAGRGQAARRSISAPSSPTGCATARRATTSRASRCGCCRRRSRRPKARA